MFFIGPFGLLSALGPWLAGLGPLAALAPLGSANGPRPANHSPWADNKPLGPSKPHYCYIKYHNRPLSTIKDH